MRIRTCAKMRYFSRHTPIHQKNAFFRRQHYDAKRRHQLPPPAVKRRSGKQNCYFSSHNSFFHFSTLQIDAFGRKNTCFIVFSGALKIVTWDLQNKDPKNAKSSLQKVCHFSSHSSNSSLSRVLNPPFLFKTHVFYSLFRCVKNRNLGVRFWKTLICKKHDFENTIKTI